MKLDPSVILLVVFLIAGCTQKVDSSLTFAPENFPNLNFTINGGDSFTRSSSVTIKVTSDRLDVEKGYIAQNDTCTGGDWFDISERFERNLTSGDGLKYFSVKVKTQYGFESQCVTQSIALDTTGPRISSESLKLDLSFTNSTTTTPTISWVGAVDAGSGVDHYEYSIGTIAGGDNTLSWTKMDNITAVKNSALTLLNKNKYYPSVRAIDKLGNIGDTVNGPSWIVDTDAPLILSVTAPTNGTYNGGVNFDFILKFNESIKVSGVPRFPVLIGANTKYAQYASGTGTDSLTFRYTTVTGDADSDGIVVIGTIDLNKGIMQDFAGNDVVLSFTAPVTSGVKITGCPANFVLVPALSPYTAKDFCVAKYEMKILGQASGDQTYASSFVAESRASGTPWVNINQPSAINECQALGVGYDLVTNAQWQTMARNIEGVAWNWSGGVVGSSGGLNYGHSDQSPFSTIEADVSDSNACANTGQSCSLTAWSNQRRVHQLSNGFYIWDLAGNVWEWIKDTHSGAMGADAYFSTITSVTHIIQASIGGLTGNVKYLFGPAGNYTSLSSTPYGGLGYGWFATSNGAIIRGGTYFNGVSAGIFSTELIVNPNSTGSQHVFGFRCVYSF